jgi:hypothetical protein
MLRRSTERPKSEAPEIEMVPQELFWGYGRFIRREDSERQKRLWRLAQYSAIVIMYAVIAACITVEALR